MGIRDDVLKEKIEVSLDGRQVFYMFFGAAVVCALVFVLGVMIGRRVESRSHQVMAGELGKDPLAALDQLESKGRSDALLFPRVLAGDRDVDGQEMAAAEPAASKPAEAKPAEVKPAEVKPAELNSSVNPAVDKRAEVKPTAVTLSDAKPTEAKSGEVKPTEAKPVQVAAGAPPPAKPAPRSDKSAAGRKLGTARFTLQLSSFQEKGEAEGFMEKVRQAGFQPYLSEAEVAGRGRFYRVRVGKYPSFETAVAAKAAFEKKQKTIAYVTRLSAE